MHGRWLTDRRELYVFDTLKEALGDRLPGSLAAE